MAVHVMPRVVRWGDCDPAGIVYYPRFFEMFHEAMETWFASCLALPYEEMILGRKLGFPSVHTEADFTRPTRFGEAIAIELSVSKLGETSIHFEYRVHDEGDPEAIRATGKTVCVVMDLDPARTTYRRAVPLPTDLRHKIDAFRG